MLLHKADANMDMFVQWQILLSDANIASLVTLLITAIYLSISLSFFSPLRTNDALTTKHQSSRLLENIIRSIFC